MIVNAAVVNAAVDVVVGLLLLLFLLLLGVVAINISYDILVYESYIFTDHRNNVPIILGSNLPTSNP